MTKKSKKVGIIVPHRNRWDQLELFKKKIQIYFKRKEIDFELIIINQDDAKLFNRGMLLNIGFKYAQQLKCDYVVFHDVDMIPIHVDYEWSPYPVHLATSFKVKNGETPREIFDEYFGGVTLFPMDDFIKIDGYSNKYWGWGYEDNDLLYRCIQSKLNLDTLKIKNQGTKGCSLRFNGNDAYVKGLNLFDFNSPLTFFISFYSDDLVCNNEQDNDEFSVFSIPGYDFSISFNSFSRYNFCAFDVNKNVVYVNSTIKTNYNTNITVTLDTENKIITVYQDGLKIGDTIYRNNLHDYTKEKYFYLGVGNLSRKRDSKFFKGNINSFAVFNKILNDNEIKDISENHYFGLSQNFKSYGSDYSLSLYYDAKFIKNYKLIDISGNNNHGEIINCEIVEVDLPEYKKIKVPHRRDCQFMSLPHEENGFHNNKWKDKSTRWNQLRYYNEVTKNEELIKSDGLSTLEFIEYGKTYDNNVLMVNVGI
jgi:hypothetical protein